MDGHQEAGCQGKGSLKSWYEGISGGSQPDSPGSRILAWLEIHKDGFPPFWVWSQGCTVHLVKLLILSHPGMESFCWKQTLNLIPDVLYPESLTCLYPKSLTCLYPKLTPSISQFHVKWQSNVFVDVKNNTVNKKKNRISFETTRIGWKGLQARTMKQEEISWISVF